ncbi:hypothetical protein GCM10009676_19640 [Prauserella halophila]|uniref:Uncharacterized protein n=1 Tax=Prauserella halophila TaxID=185641 RepID=A0ABP4GRP9_9PSEU
MNYVHEVWNYDSPQAFSEIWVWVGGAITVGGVVVGGMLTGGTSWVAGGVATAGGIGAGAAGTWGF